MEETSGMETEGKTDSDEGIELTDTRHLELDKIEWVFLHSFSLVFGAFVQYSSWKINKYIVFPFMFSSLADY